MPQKFGGDLAFMSIRWMNIPVNSATMAPAKRAVTTHNIRISDLQARRTLLVLKIRLVLEQSFHTFDNACGVCLGTCSFDANLFCFADELLREEHGDHQYRNLRRLAKHLAGGLQSVHFRHLKVDHNNIRNMLPETPYSFQAVTRLRAYTPIVPSIYDAPLSLPET